MNAHLFPFTDPVVAEQNSPKQMVSGDGCYVTDSQGNTYLDMVAGLWCASLGFNPPALRDAATKQMSNLAYYHSFMGRTCEVTDTLATRLVNLLPDSINHVFFGTSGSEAVENAIKFMRYYQNARGKPNKKKIIAREGAYHGSGHISAALTGMSYCHDGFDLPMGHVLRINRPHFVVDAHPEETEVTFAKRLAHELEHVILQEGAENIGAFIGEPLMGSGGVFLPPEGYWPEVQNILAKHDILLIADEIITGFGRTGEWFACETFDIKPDMMTLAKQMTGAVFPMSAVAMTNEIRDTIADHAHSLGTLGHGVTYGGHPVGAAIAHAALDTYEAMNLPNHVKTLGAHLAKSVEPLAMLPGVLNVRSLGLIAAVEFDDIIMPGSQFAMLVGKEAEQKGVLFRIIGNTLAISPPYIVKQEEISTSVEIMRNAIKTILDMQDC